MVWADEITWQPWLAMPGYSRFQFAGAWGASRYRVLFEGPVGRAWFLGDHFMRQTMGNPTQEIPSAPPLDMRSTESLTPREVNDLMLGVDADLFLEEGEYAIYRHTYLMPPLIGVRTPTRKAADMPSSNRARATDIPSTSRASKSRGRARGMPSTCQYAGWPVLPTELMGWQYGSSYPIPLEPPLPDHRYVSDPDSPPPPREYTEGLLEVVASLESMVLRRETLLYASGISVTPL
ncbi:uncharacterized protein LOC114256875 [Camellia sinensis]|uniref:uncharacterized protein LOC114256875 n=1 Tax=Camellia sinensis TaxID=4442 RepID=UPI001036B0C1|nr:uncharacterized protein LOC114256875 [Camellia sinensis]